MPPASAHGHVPLGDSGELLTIDGGAQHWGETWTTGKPDYFKVAD